jgi:N-acetyl-anhydromuramyl-L-alanine amidase AmpD
MSVEQLDLSTLVQANFPESEYYKIETPKNQILIHHTVSGPNANGVINWWIQDPGRVATHFIVDGNGTIYQLYSSKYWAHHLGIKSTFLQQQGFSDYGTRNVLLNQSSVAIETCRWGGLIKDANGFHPSLWDANSGKEIGNPKIVIPPENVVTFNSPFRSYQYFEKYTDQQITSLMKLVNYLCDKFDIPKDYNPGMWDISKDALGGKPGIWTHVSYRPDKSDMCPQPELISALQSLSM